MSVMTAVCQKDVLLDEVASWVNSLQPEALTIKREGDTWTVGMKDYTLTVEWKEGTAALIWNVGSETTVYGAYREELMQSSANGQ